MRPSARQLRTSLTWLAVLAAATAAADLRSDIEARYRQWDRAYFMKDVKGLAELLHPKFQLVTAGGKTVTRVRYVASLWRGTLPETYRTRVLRVQARGSRCLVWTREDARPPGEATHTHLYRDTWANTSSGWLMVESRTISKH